MKRQPSDRGRDALIDWFGRVPGRLILARERTQLDTILPDLFGYHLVQVGEVGEEDLTRNSRVLNRQVASLGDQIGSPLHSFATAAQALPIQSDSIDVVVLPHVLEFEANPHEALREVQRILVPEGHLVICGFNPWSWLGARRLLTRKRQMPWSGQFISLNRMKDWLALLGFDVTSNQTFFFTPPVASENVIDRLSLLERFGQKVGASLGGVYVLVAKKRVSTMTPIRPRWSARRRLVSVGLVEPTTRVARARSIRRRG